MTRMTIGTMRSTSRTSTHNGARISPIPSSSTTTSSQASGSRSTYLVGPTA